VVFSVDDIAPVNERELALNRVIVTEVTAVVGSVQIHLCA
jgi:hypothetical protein